MELCWIRHHLHRLETGQQQPEITGEMCTLQPPGKWTLLAIIVKSIPKVTQV